jgi:hypothetical protein
MAAGCDGFLSDLDRDGFVIVPDVVPTGDVAAVLADLHAALATDANANPVRSAGGSIYAARNLLELWPGPGYGLVRGLFFDKPPDRTWALPWHKDLTIAVRDNRRPSKEFTKPTSKAGVPHAEAPVQILEQMLTARIHLDDTTEENGPLRVLPGSHKSGKDLRCEGFIPHTILARAGDVLLMRPLLAHASNCSQPGTQRHRRVIHLEFACAGDLPGGFEWYDFRPGAGQDRQRWVTG